MEAAIGSECAAPDAVLVDVGLPGMSGIEGIPLLRKRWPRAAVIVLTVFADDKRVMEAMCAGAHGYLLKKTPPARIIEALEQAIEGGSPMSPEIARRVVELFRISQQPAKGEYGLTPHEGRLLRLLVDGHSYKSAAVELRVSVNTIGFHVRQIYRKLEVHSKSEAVAKALRAHIMV
jgi:DNA-binding NarL/FixJ family response regulator